MSAIYLEVRLAIGASVTVKKRVVGIKDTLNGIQYDVDFFVLGMDDKFDAILGLPFSEGTSHAFTGSIKL